jgi:RNA polymerase sigma-70 factor, ECF subfamily
MPEEIPSTELVKRWNKGDQLAAAELFERYQQSLIRLVASHLNQQMKQRLDPEDLVQSIINSVFRMTRDKPIEYSNEAGFWKWLVTVALHKMYNRIDKETAKKNGGKVTFVERFDFDERICHEPIAEDVAQCSDLIESILARLGDRQKKVLQLKLDGFDDNEIARQLGVSSKTIQRMGPALREAAIEVFGYELPGWKFSRTDYERFWQELRQEPLTQWLDEPITRLAAQFGLNNLGETLDSESSPLEVLTQIKSGAKKSTRFAFGPDTGYPVEILACAYMLAIANADLMHQSKISRDPPKEIVQRVQLLLKETWIDAKSRERLQRYLAMLLD